MRRKSSTTLVSFFTTLLIFTPIFLYISRNIFSGETIHLPSTTPLKNPSSNNLVDHLSYLIEEEDLHLNSSSSSSSSTSSISEVSSSPDSILLPDWEVLYIKEESFNFNTFDIDDDHQYMCVFQNNATSVAEFTGSLRNSKRFIFKCDVPVSVRRLLRPLLSPILTNSNETWPETMGSNWPEMLRWNYLAYESLSTENDVVLFVKGVNNRQGVNRSPEEFNCVFYNGINYSVKTIVISSSQEVFRCNHPKNTEISRLFLKGNEKVRVSVEIKEKQTTVPTVAYYTTNNKQIGREDTTYSQLCACTMVHNVGKFLKEWIVYHSKLGVGKFIFYDNDSDDDLGKVVQELVLNAEYNVEIVNWPWPKTQEAGFSHSAIYGKGSCKWMMYMDVDEFVFSPSWLNATAPSSDMLLSLLPKNEISSSSSPSASLSPSSADKLLPWLSRPIGQVYIKCLEFGPSNQQSHPSAGVTQGYTCRRRVENRHKSIVLLDVIDHSLQNAIHHFKLKDGYRVKTLRLNEGVVNHYKYQAWSEFKAKFRRRVSAYVVDWNQKVNPMSKDRTPGLGYEPIEPEGWANKFCEVNDSRLKKLTQRWFSLADSSATTGSKLAWQE